MRSCWNVIRYLCVLFLIWKALFFYGNYGFFLVLVLWLILPLFALSCNWYMLKKLEVSFEKDSVKVGANLQVPIKVVINNPTIFPAISGILVFSIKHRYYGEESIKKLEIPIYGKGRSMYILPVASKYCGCVEVHLRKVKIRDFLGFLELKKDMNKECDGYVFPYLEDIKSDFIENSKAVKESPITYEKSYENEDEWELREYQQGEKLQLVHWKLYGKTGELYLKQFQNSQMEEKKLLFELYDDKNGSLDTMLYYVFGLSCCLLKRGETFCLCWFSVAEQRIKEQKIEDEIELEAAFVEIYYECSYEEHYFQDIQLIEQQGYYYLNRKNNS